MSNFALVMSPKDVQEVTGCKRHTTQIQALGQMGIPFYVRPDGSPCVAKNAISGAPPEAKPVPKVWDLR